MKRRARVLNQAELDRLLKTHSDARTQGILMATHLAGLRVHEVAALKIGDVIHADGSMKEQLVIIGKGRKLRVIPVSERLQGYFKAAIPNNYQLDWPLFPGKRGKHFNPSALSHWISLRYAEAGFVGGTGNSGRRSFMSRMKSAGVDLRTVQELAGHGSLAFTQAYLDVSDEDMRKAVSIL